MGRASNSPARSWNTTSFILSTCLLCWTRRFSSKPPRSCCPGGGRSDNLTRRGPDTNSIATILKRNRPMRHRLGVAVCLAGILVLFMDGCARDPVVRAEKSYERAEKYLKENNPDAAVIELRRALQLNPQLAKAHFALGTVELQRGATLTAFQEFFAASIADPD